MNKVLALLCLLLAVPSSAATYGPYRAAVLRVVDGDTFEADLFLYPSLKVATLVRLIGIDTPELRGETACERALALRARDHLATMAFGPAEVKDVEPDKYGSRILATVAVNGVDLASAMVAAGHGRPYSGGKRRPWCVG